MGRGTPETITRGLDVVIDTFVESPSMIELRISEVEGFQVNWLQVENKWIVQMPLTLMSALSVHLQGRFPLDQLTYLFEKDKVRVYPHISGEDRTAIMAGARGMLAYLREQGLL